MKSIFFLNTLKHTLILPARTHLDTCYKNNNNKKKKCGKCALKIKLEKESNLNQIYLQYDHSQNQVNRQLSSGRKREPDCSQHQLIRVSYQLVLKNMQQG